MLGRTAIDHEHAVGAENSEDVGARASDQQERVGEFVDGQGSGSGFRLGGLQESARSYCNASCGGAKDSEKVAAIGRRAHR